MAGNLASKTTTAGSRLDVLTAFGELWDYVLVVVNGKNMPNYLRYSIGEEVLKELQLALGLRLPQLTILLELQVLLLLHLGQIQLRFSVLHSRT